LEIIEIVLGSSDYPELLKQIADPPKKLFVWGNPEILRTMSLAMVGSRKPSDYGLRVSAYLAKDLSRYFTIISGLAYGIDTIVLTEALAHGKAVGVIGSGLDQTNFYPANNWNLAKRIVEQGGAIISEYPIGTPPLKHHFVARNRIIAGLSRGVVIVEAANKSGALITADFALQFNREVLAVAGSIFTPQAVGTNRLIQDGARMVTHPSDVLDSFNIQPIAPHEGLKNDLSAEERAIINILNERVNGLSVNELATFIKLDTAKVSSTLTMMEIKGVVKNTQTGKFTCLVN